MAAVATSWNLQAKVSTDDLKFAVPAHLRALRDKVLTFVEEEVFPTEGDDAAGSGSVTRSGSAIQALQAKAKAAGLWALGHPREIGGRANRLS